MTMRFDKWRVDIETEDSESSQEVLLVVGSLGQAVDVLLKDLDAPVRVVLTYVGYEDR